MTESELSRLHDPLAKIPDYKACAVRISKAEERELVRPQAAQKRGSY